MACLGLLPTTAFPCPGVEQVFDPIGIQVSRVQRIAVFAVVVGVAVFFGTGIVALDDPNMPICSAGVNGNSR